jgi:hypothetical protein
MAESIDRLIDELERRMFPAPQVREVLSAVPLQTREEILAVMKANWVESVRLPDLPELTPYLTAEEHARLVDAVTRPTSGFPPQPASPP